MTVLVHHYRPTDVSKHSAARSLPAIFRPDSRYSSAMLTRSVSLPTARAPSTRPSMLRRNATIIGAVLLLHGLGIWALQTGLLQRAVELIVPVEAISDAVVPPKPVVEKPVVKAPEPPRPVPLQHTTATPPPTPVPVAIAEPSPEPAPNAVTGTTAPQPALAPIGTPTSPAAAPRIELPSSNAEYLHNPKPVYPRISKMQGEQGKVVVSVLIGVDGTVQDAKLKTSCGYTRLDQVALDTVKSWRYVPGKRGGVPEPMWFNVPINFVLE